MLDDGNGSTGDPKLTRRTIVRRLTILAVGGIGALPRPGWVQTPGASLAAGAAFQVPGYPPFSPPPPMLELVEERGARVLVRDLFGEVEVPRDPQRVVALDEATLEILLTLGLEPVAAAHLGTRLPIAVESLAAGVVSLPERDLGINVEAVAALAPDLIVGLAPVDDDPALYELFGQIAPTVAFLDNPLVYWERAIHEVGGLLGRAAAAEAALAGFEARLGSARVAVSSAVGSGTTFAVILFFPGSVWLYGPMREVDGRYLSDPATRWIYQDLRLPPPAEVRQLVGLEGFVELSLEVAPTLTADHLVVFPGGYNAEPVEGYDELVADPLWQAVPAVRNGNVHTIRADRASGLYTTLLVVDRFVEAVTGPPAPATPHGSGSVIVTTPAASAEPAA